MSPRLQPAPPVDVDRDEDRFEEEEDALEGERDAEGRPPLTHELRPEQPELERQHGPAHGADREGDRHVLRPALGQQERVAVTLQAPIVRDQGHEGPRHTERHQDDVARERERHLHTSPRDRINGNERGDQRGHHADHSGSHLRRGNALADNPAHERGACSSSVYLSATDGLARTPKEGEPYGARGTRPGGVRFGGPHPGLRSYRGPPYGCPRGQQWFDRLGVLPPVRLGRLLRSAPRH